MKTYRTAKAAIMDRDGNFLLLRRSDSHPTMAHDMDLPGGIIEDGEQPVTCLAREIAEETSLHIAEKDLKLFFAMTEEYANENAVRQVFFTRLKASKPTINLSWEHDKYMWLPLDSAIETLEESRYPRKGLVHLRGKNILEDI
jgi:8-oxo-dGTP pyrophosphatase MutT (NUDIX family)